MSIISWLNRLQRVYFIKWGNMEEFYINTITFISQLDPLVKGLIVGILLMLDVLCIKTIIKDHVNAKKPTFKIGQYILLIVLIALTIFICIHAF